MDCLSGPLDRSRKGLGSTGLGSKKKRAFAVALLSTAEHVVQKRPFAIGRAVPQLPGDAAGHGRG